MAQTPIETHLADYLLKMNKPQLKAYRNRCLNHWREHYGETIASKVEKLVNERWKKK